jgi:hypothetical protein
MFSNPDLWKSIFGRLTWQDILPETIVVYTFIVVAIGGIAAKKIMITPWAVKIWS